jgi:hypothetical protein
MTDTQPKTLPGDPKEPFSEPKKRGRPAGSGAGAKASNDVEQALAMLETAYGFLALGLTMVGAPMAASELSEKIAYVQEQNRQFLIADRKLAATIARVGAASGRAGFIATNLMAIAPVAMLASKEIQARRVVNVSRETTAEASAPVYNEDVPTVMEADPAT